MDINSILAELRYIRLSDLTQVPGGIMVKLPDILNPMFVDVEVYSQGGAIVKLTMTEGVRNSLKSCDNLWHEWHNGDLEIVKADDGRIIFFLGRKDYDSYEDESYEPSELSLFSEESEME